MANKVHSVSFTLIAVIDGEDAVSLDVSPSAVIWNQEGDVTTDDDGTIHDNSSWPEMYVSASVIKGGAADGGWTFSYSKSSGSYTVKKGTLNASGKFTESTSGNVFQLSSPVAEKGSSSLWTNGSIKITATKNNRQLVKDVSIALNALATWKLSVINGSMSAVSSKVDNNTERITKIEQDSEHLSTTVEEQGKVFASVGITKDGISVTGNMFKWSNTPGTQLLYMDDSGNLNIAGNVSARTINTSSGNFKVDENGILTAAGANIQGSVIAGSRDGKAVELNDDGSMVIYGDGHDYRTEHTGQTFDAIDDVLPGATYTPTYNKTTYKVVTGYIRTGGSSNSVTMATLRPTATGNLTIQLSSLKVYINARAAGVEARAEILWNNNVVYRGSIMPKSAQDISSDISNEWKNLTLHVFANKGVAYDLQLRVTITSYLLTELDQQTCATAEAALSNIMFSSNIYRSMFFGNGLALSQGSSNSFVAMVDSGGNAIVQGRSGNFGVRLSKDGISYMLDGNNWLPLNDGTVDTSTNYTIEAGIGTVICQNTSAITITMPKSPYKGQKIIVIQGNNNLTFMPNGKTFRWRNVTRSTVTSSYIGQKTEFYFNGTYWQVFQVNSETPY